MAEDAVSSDAPPPPAPYAAAETLEAALGDPFDDAALSAFRTAVALDEKEEFPHDLVARLVALGVPSWLVPRRDGGELHSWEQALAIMRALARRDLTPAIYLGSSVLGALPVWLWGSEAQRTALVREVRAGQAGSFALSEEAHGSDVLASDLRAARDGDAWLLSGSKWTIGNATRGAWATIFARTDERGGPGGFSLLHVHKRDLDPATWAPLPRVRTLGVRAHDISGLRFDGCRVPASALLGAAGTGFEKIHKTFQISRTLISGLALGAADSALRIALGWTRARRLYDRPVFELPAVARLLLGSFVDLLIADCVAVSASRALTAAPEQMCLWSSVAKYLVPTLAEQVVRDAAAALGARFYLREGVAAGAFQKLYRDSAIASVFDGTALVNLFLVATQLPAVARAGPQAEAADRIRPLFDRAVPLPVWDPARVRFRAACAGADDITAALPSTLDAAVPLARGDAAGALARLAPAVRAMYDMLHVAIRHHAPAMKTVATVGCDLARTHCLLHAAAACVAMWVHNQGALDEGYADGRWLALCLERILAIHRGVGGSPPLADGTAEGGAALAQLVALHQGRRSFSLFPMQLA